MQLTLVDSFLTAYRRYGASPLTETDADRYVAEQAGLAERLGVDDPAPPRSVAELAAQLAAFTPELHVGRAARDAVRFLLFPPLPIAVRPAYGIIAAAAVSALPPAERRGLWLPRLPLTEAVAVPIAARTVVRLLGWVMQPASDSSLVGVNDAETSVHVHK